MSVLPEEGSIQKWSRDRDRKYTSATLRLCDKLLLLEVHMVFLKKEIIFTLSYCEWFVLWPAVKVSVTINVPLNTITNISNKIGSWSLWKNNSDFIFFNEKNASPVTAFGVETYFLFEINVILPISSHPIYITSCSKRMLSKEIPTSSSTKFPMQLRNWSSIDANQYSFRWIKIHH